jgi:hypothetical protein
MLGKGPGSGYPKSEKIFRKELDRRGEGGGNYALITSKGGDSPDPGPNGEVSPRGAKLQESVMSRLLKFSVLAS